MRSSLCIGSVWHTRREPVAHRFRYPAWYLAAAADEISDLDRTLRLFGHNRARPVAIRDADHLGDARGTLDQRLEQRLAEHGVALPAGGTVLITTPRLFGYTFNPISLWLRLGADEEILGGAAEVNSTFGEGRVYPLVAPRRDGQDTVFDAPKELHVSPFLETLGSYRFRIRFDAECFRLGIDLRQDERRILSAGVETRRIELTDGGLARVMLQQPLSTWRTLPRILAQAGRLYFGRKLPVVPQPDPVDGRTYLASRRPWLSEFRVPPFFERWLAPRVTGATDDDRGNVENP